jgi:iron complex transport system ATP-binding protein
LWAQQPTFMLLDEPLQHLDLRHQLRTLELIRAAANERGAGIALVLHDLQYAHRCDRILMLYGDGRYVAGAAAQLLEPARLSELYDCDIHACGRGADTHFVPVI